MTEKLKNWTAFLISAASALTALSTVMHCAAEKEEMQRAVQVLAEMAFK